jgi:non-ribosomal peptide synthetase component E (peptide arylation enzyme)
VLDAKLVAMPDPVYGEKGCAFIVVRPGEPVPDVAQMIEFLTSQGLAKFKCPERIEVVDAFPLTRVGKVDKSAMRKLIADKLADETATHEPLTKAER